MTTISALDLVLEPPPSVKKSACGKSTLVIIYTNGTICVRTYRCHRWDCPLCGQERKESIIRDLEAIRSEWYSIIIDDEQYERIRKRAKRAGAGYCAIGRGDEVMMLTDLPVFNDGKILAGEQLRGQVEKHIDQCSYSHRQRRIRHNQGLFPAKPQSSKDVHIRRQIGVNDTKHVIVGKFRTYGYYEENYSSTATYLRQTRGSCTPEEIIVADEGLSKVLWAQ